MARHSPGEVNQSVLQCVAVCCSVLQCVAVCCSVLQCVVVCRQRKQSRRGARICVVVCCTVCCSVLQCVAVCCSVTACCSMFRCLDGKHSPDDENEVCCCVL